VVVWVVGQQEYGLPARVVDYSRWGLGLLLEVPLPVAAAVSVCVKDDTLFGVVCHCRAQAGSYSAGIRLDEVLTAVLDLSLMMKPPASAGR
jgi:hypothetical protein